MMPYFVWDYVYERIEDFETLKEAASYIQRRLDNKSISYFMSDDFMIIKGEEIPIEIDVQGRKLTLPSPPET